MSSSPSPVRCTQELLFRGYYSPTLSLTTLQSLSSKKIRLKITQNAKGGAKKRLNAGLAHGLATMPDKRHRPSLKIEAIHFSKARLLEPRFLAFFQRFLKKICNACARSWFHNRNSTKTIMNIKTCILALAALSLPAFSLADSETEKKKANIATNFVNTSSKNLMLMATANFPKTNASQLEPL